MALSTLRLISRPSLLRCGHLALAPRSVPMATSAQEQMKEFWKKNQALQRPNSPWMIHHWPLVMMTSLAHRVTGLAMGVSLYGISIGLFLAPGDFASYVEVIKAMNISPALMFTAKSIVAFPVVYHYISGIRHLGWDAGYNYRLGSQLKTGYATFGVSTAIALLLASISYW